MPSRNEIEIVINATDRASGALDGMLDKISGIGTSLMKTGAAISAATAPIAIALGAAVSSAVAFDSSMTNVGAVMGKSRTEMASLNKEVLRIGSASRAGPQAAAEAFYDIVGGVSDASAHMAILEASVRTAEAGNADLGSTTNALISVMNSYKFGAEDAAYASDVLTRTVGMGVGTMGDFASALPSITGLAKSLKVSFGDLASETAYLTTQGNTASQATTQLSAMMTTMLNPNENMKKALTELGFSSGQAAVEQLGLVGAMNALRDTSVANTEGMAKMLGSTEALRGVTALAGPEFSQFTKNFTDGIKDATTAAQAVQLDSPAAQMDLFKSKISALGITVGTILIPPLIDLSNKIMPIVDGVVAWAGANPEAMTTIVGIALAAVAAGPVIGMLGMAITAVSTAVGILISPAFLLAGAIGAILLAAQLGYPGGIVGLFQDAARTAQQLAFLGLYVLNLAAQTVRTAIEGMTSKIRDGLTAFGDLYSKSPDVKRAVDGIAFSVGLLTLAWGAMQLRVIATNGVMALYTGIMWGLAAAKSALALASTAAAGGMTAFVASASAAVLPILAIAGAVAAVVAAVNHFNDVTKAGRDAANAQVAQQSAAGGLTEDQLWQQTKRSVVAEYGADNPITDGIARKLFDELKANMVTPVAGARAGGGDVIGGRNYLVGEKGPEIWRAPADGTITPNSDIGKSSGVQFNGPMSFYGNTKAEGAAMADGFMGRMDELIRKGG